MTPSSEQIYFEKAELWEADKWEPLVFERVRLALEWLPANAASVLDIGCGNGLFVNRLTGHALVVGLDYSLAALQWVKANPCRGDAGRLPFAAQSFEVVVSTEMIEHLPTPLYHQALGEMTRVAQKYILLTVPYQEERQYASVTCPLCGCQFHPYYHVRSFYKAELEALFSSYGFTLQRYAGICPVAKPAWPWAFDQIRRLYHRRGKNFPTNTTCPQCSYSPAQPAASTSRQPSIGKTNRGLLKQIWPKIKSYEWWIALYQRDQ